MSTKIQRQIASSNENALVAFVQKKAEIDAMLTRLQALSDDHFNYSPDDISWDSPWSERCSGGRRTSGTASRARR